MIHTIEKLNLSKRNVYWTFGIFFVFVAVLLVSYIFKLGYLKIATFSLLIAIPFLAFFNILRHPKAGSTSWRESTLFWAFLFFAFIYVLLDKYYRLHIIFSRYLADYVSFDPVLFINIAYLIAFLLAMIVFHKYLQAEFKTNSFWMLLFFLAATLKAVGIGTDFLFHDITEDYFEVFSLYFFAASFIHLSLRGKTK